MAFYVGQKVVALDWSYVASLGERPWDVYPIKDQIYTVSAVIPFLDRTSIKLQEIRNPKMQYIGVYDETSFDQNGFRPAIERKTDISIFTAMLTPKRQSVDA